MTSVPYSSFGECGGKRKETCTMLQKIRDQSLFILGLTALFFFLAGCGSGKIDYRKELVRGDMNIQASAREYETPPRTRPDGAVPRD
ncbi:MAG: hypothetical protein D6679_05155 [Candidatus Hydrogenedentota bacterium]|nr:MAG: hypothetical protein D6679_05155 [Candidatus Hydrogenedentota bacterium]